MLIAFCADKGSPGATTAALAIAAASPSGVVVVEADPSGGDLALRLRPHGVALPETPTALSALTAARRSSEVDPIASHAHVLNVSTSVVPGPLLAEQMAGVGDWSPLSRALARPDTVAMVDVGHLWAGSPVAGLAAAADVVVIVARPDVASIVRLRERVVRLGSDLAQLRRTPARFVPLLVTTARHGAGDCADLLALLIDTPARPFVADVTFLAHDPAALRRLEAGEDPAGRLARSDLLRTARSAVTAIAAAVGAPESSVLAAPTGRQP
jgi:hypothetical protein